MNLFQVHTGKVFVVLVFKDWVVKIPYRGYFSKSLKHSPKKNTKTLKELCELQNELHKLMPESILPCHFFGQFLVSPRAMGIPNKESSQAVEKVVKQARDLGYSLGDVHEPSNYRYNGQVKIIDYSHLQKYEKQ